MSKQAWLISWLVLIAVVLTRGTLGQQGVNGSDLQGAALTLMNEARSDDSLEAMAVMVAVSGEALFEGGVGLERPGRAASATVDTSFAAGPIAHSMLVTATLQFEDAGKLNREDLVHAHLPSLVAETCPVRIGDLLAHTSGLPDFRDFASAELMKGAPSYAQLAALVSGMPLEADPGECVAESATDTLLLAALLRKVAEAPVDEVLQSSIFDKLGMRDTEYKASEKGAQVSEASAEKEESPAAFLPRGLSSTVADLTRFQRGLVELKLVDSDVLEVMLDPIRLVDGTETHQGMGVTHVLLNETKGVVIGEPGAGFGAHVAFYPELDLTIAVMARGAKGSLAGHSRSLARLVIEEKETSLLDIALSDDAMEAYLGSYQIGCTTLMIRADVGRIMLDQLDEAPLILMYQGDHHFVAQEDPDIRLEFELEGELAISFILDKHGMRSKAVRFEQDR